MPEAQTPFHVAGELAMPPDAGQPDAHIPFVGSGAFSSRQHSQLNLVGAGTQDVSFGSVGAPGAKFVLVEVDADAAGLPLTLAINGGNSPVEISPGGFLACYNPAPQAGITTLSVAHATSAVVRIWVLG